MATTLTQQPNDQADRVEYRPRPGSPDAHPRLFVLAAIILGILAVLAFRIML